VGDGPPVLTRFEDVRAQARARGAEDDLGETVDALFAYADDVPSAEFEYAMRRIGHAGLTTIGELVDAGERLFHAHTFGPSRAAVLEALSRWVGATNTPMATHESGPLDFDALPRPLDLRSVARRLEPEAGPALERWLAAADVVHVLEQPAEGWVDYAQLTTLRLAFALRGRITVRQALLEPPSSFDRQRMLTLKTAILQRLERLVDQVERGHAYDARTRPLERAPSVPALQPLFAALREAYAAVRDRIGPREPKDGMPGLSLTAVVTGRSPGFTGASNRDGPYAPTVTVPVARWRRGVAWRCSVDGERAICPHALVTLEAVLLHLSAPEHRATAEALVDFVAQPLWARAIDELEEVERRHQEREVELGWWLETRTPHVVTSVQPTLRRRGKRGEWLAPRPASRDTVLKQDLDLNETDRVALDVVAFERGSKVTSWGLVRSLVDALAGHPRVVAGAHFELARPVKIERVEPTIELVRDGDQVKVQHVLGALRRDPVEDGELVLDLPNEAIYVARLTRATRTATHRLAEVLPEVGPDELPALAERVARVDPKLKLAARALVPVEEEAARDHWLLRLATRDDGGLEARLFVVPLVGGPACPAGEPPEVALAPGTEGRLRAARRDLPRETAGALERWQGWGLDVERGDPVQVLPTTSEALAFLSAVRDEPRAVIEWSTKPIKVLPRARRLRLELTQGADWFGLRGELDLDEHQASLAMLLDAARQRSPFVRVGEDTWLEVERAVMERLVALEPHVRRVRDRLEVGALSAPAVTELLDDDAREKQPARWAALVARARAAHATHPEVPRALRAELRAYQREGFAWLARLARWGAGAVLADDMGLGKTVQTIAVLLDRADEGPAIVVAPTSVTHNWRRELERFAPTLRVRDLRDALGPFAAGDVLVTSYGLVVRAQETLRATRFASLVLDEAQMVKNASAQRAQAVRALEADWRLALSGTPVENHLGELWAVFAAVSPGLLGSWEQFRERWIGRTGAALDGLRRVVRPFLLRRTKREVLTELPPKTEVRVDVELSASERKLYEDARVAAVAQLQSLGAELQTVTGRFQVLAALTRLRQLACDASMVVDGREPPPPSSKLERFVELARGLVEEGHALIAFSQFTKLLDRAEAQLAAAGLEFLRLDGETPAAKRGALVERFQSGPPTIFLVSLRAGGTGLNLTAADYVVHLDPWWNPAVEDQATDRAHRIGQTRPVTVLRLVTRDTVESTILDLHAEKRALAAEILDGGDGRASTPLDADALLAILRGDGGLPNVSDEEAVPSTRPSAREPAQAVRAEPVPQASRRPSPPSPPVPLAPLAPSADDDARAADDDDATPWDDALDAAQRAAIEDLAPSTARRYGAVMMTIVERALDRGILPPSTAEVLTGLWTEDIDAGRRGRSELAVGRAAARRLYAAAIATTPLD
jgi:superfamily II DNA or RNA helicase